MRGNIIVRYSYQVGVWVASIAHGGSRIGTILVSTCKERKKGGKNKGRGE